MVIQATYDNTGLVPDEAAEKADKSGKFDVKWRSDDNVHVMLYPNQFLDAKVQVLRFSANVWCKDPSQLYEIEELLNRTFRDKGKRKPFKQPKIQLLPGEQKEILETALGLISTFVYYHCYEIADSITHILQNMSTWDQWQDKRKYLKV